MSIIDIIFMFFGALLIFAGLYLFVSGKKDTSNNNVEGFGIKLNVSNPSIILILSGIGLLVLPRFMPETLPPEIEPVVGPVIDPVPVIQPVIEPVVGPVIEPVIQPVFVFFPEKSWQLNSYQENGVEFIVPLQVNATILFSNRSANQTHWTTNVSVLNMNGNVSNNSFNGKITFVNNGYTISFLGSTASDFEPEFNIPLELKIENGDILHMSYRSRSGEEIVHWQQ